MWTIRVRSNVGVWRVEGLEPTATVTTIQQKIAQTRPQIQYEASFSSDPACRQPFHPSHTLQQLGLTHGAMIYCRVDPTTCADIREKTGAAATITNDDGAETAVTATPSHTTMRRVIAEDGSIKLVPSNEAPRPGEDKGFRKGMLALRDMKMQWTLADFVALDSQFEFKIKRQESAICKQVSLDIPSVSDFQAYLQRFLFARKRFGFLYGTFVSNDDDDTKADDSDKRPTKVMVEAIYEPPQQPDEEAAEGFIVLDDPNEERVEKIATLLGLRRVGWIFGHEAREPGFVLSAAEIIMAAEYQLEAASGLNETPFVTVTVAPAQDGTVSVEAFQVSQQCMAMVAEQALEVGPDPKVCLVNETFSAIQEGKESKSVENNFFLCVVPIVQHTSQTLIAEFPRFNRGIDERTPSHEAMKRQLQKSGTAGWTFEDRLADFNLLIYLCQFLDIDADFPKICASIVDRSIALDDGYKLIIKSMAGMDGSY